MRLKIFCGFLLFIFACSKNPWKQPTSISFELGLSSTQFLGGDLVLHTGHLEVGSFVFEGEREQGGAVYFDTDYEQPVQVNLHITAVASANGNVPAPVLDFDVPQGVYNSMDLRLGTAKKTSVLVLEGELTLAQSDPMFVRLELEGAEQWSIPTKNQARQQQPITLGSAHTRAEIILQPHAWITENQRALWEMGEMVIVNGRPTLLVNPTTNVELYRAISKLFLDSQPCAIVAS